MKKIIDANFFQDLSLEKYLSTDKNNMAIFTDYACMETYQGNSVKNIYNSLKIVSNYPDQIIVLKGTRKIIKMKLSSKGLQKRMVDKDQTDNFDDFCNHVYLAYKGDTLRTNLLKELGEEAKDQFKEVQADASGLGEAINEMQLSFTTKDISALRKRQHLSDEFLDQLDKTILLLTANLCKDHPDVKSLPKYPQVHNHFIFRFAIAAIMLVIFWISEGGAKDVKPEKLRNDIIDLNYVAYATYFDGIFTNDKKAKQLYRLTRYYLDEVFSV